MFIVKRFIKLVKIVPLRLITAFDIAIAFTAHWEFIYVATKSVLTDNGKQFNAKFFLELHFTLVTKARFTTKYHPRANCRTERFSSAILASIR